MSTEWDYDMIVVGAGPAGCVCALAAARLGFSVLVVDKAKLPRDKACGDFISSRAVGVLRRMGLLERLLEAPHTRVASIMFHAPDGQTLKVPLIKFNEDDPVTGVICRRVIFDDILQQAVRECCEVRDWCRVLELLTEHGRAMGVRADYGGGRELVATARVVIGADGAESVVARAMRMPRYREYRSLAAATYYRQVLGTQGCLEVYFPENILPGYLWIHPTESGFTNVGMSVPLAAARRLNMQPKKALAAALASPELRETFAFAEMVEPLKVSPLPVANVLREIHGEGFMLVGDAAGLVHPCSAVGVSNAMYSGALAVEVLGELLLQEGKDATADHLARYPYRLWKELGPSVDLAGRLMGLRTPKAVGSLLRSASRRPDNAAWISSILLGSALPSDDMDDFLSYLNFFTR